MENRFALLEICAALLGISLWFVLVPAGAGQGGQARVQVSRGEERAAVMPVAGGGTHGASRRTAGGER